jgi:hypothetical protein
MPNDLPTKSVILSLCVLRIQDAESIPLDSHATETVLRPMGIITVGNVGGPVRRGTKQSVIASVASLHALITEFAAKSLGDDVHRALGLMEPNTVLAVLKVTNIKTLMCVLAGI